MLKISWSKINGTVNVIDELKSSHLHTVNYSILDYYNYLFRLDNYSIKIVLEMVVGLLIEEFIQYQ